MLGVAVESFEIASFEVRVFGVGIDFALIYDPQTNSLSLAGGAGVIFSGEGSLSVDLDDLSVDSSGNLFATLETAAGLSALGLGVGAGLNVTIDDGQLLVGGNLDVLTLGLSGERVLLKPVVDPNVPIVGPSLEIPLQGPNSCFPAQTPITLPNQTTKPISEIVIGDLVLSYDEGGNLVSGTVTRLLENVTTEWVKLTDNKNPTWELIATQGHHFLRPDGSFAAIADIIADDGCIVHADGYVIEVQAELIKYNAETAHLFEQQAMMKTWTSGGLALQPEYVEGWKTYNFTVAETHTYIANDIRVHNDSILSFLEEGDTVYALSDDLKDMAVARDTDGDGANEIVLLDGQRFTDANGGDTFLEVEQTFIPNDPNADVEALLAQFIENNPEAASNVYDPGNGNVPGDGIPSDDIGGTFSNRKFGGVEVPTLDALVLAAVTGGADGLVETLFAPMGDVTTDLSYASGDGDVSITPTGPDSTAILLFILGLDAGAEIVPGIPDPFGGTIGGVTLGDLLGGLDLPDLGQITSASLSDGMFTANDNATHNDSNYESRIANDNSAVSSPNLRRLAA